MDETISIRDKKIKFKIDLTTKIKKEGDCFVAWCPAIGISSKGETKENTLKNLEKTVKLFVAACHGKGFFNKLIKKQRDQSRIGFKEPGD